MMKSVYLERLSEMVPQFAKWFEMKEKKLG